MLSSVFSTLSPIRNCILLSIVRECRPTCEMTSSVVSWIGRCKFEREYPSATTYSQLMHDVRAKTKFRIPLMGRIVASVNNGPSQTLFAHIHAHPDLIGHVTYRRQIYVRMHTLTAFDASMHERGFAIKATFYERVM